MSNIFSFVLRLFANNVIIALAFISIVIGNFDNTIGRLFVDKARIVATGSLQSMEMGPIALSKYEDLVAEFKSDKILENWNKRTNLDKSLIPEKKHIEMFSDYADFQFPEAETVRRYAKTALYEITIENTGNLVAEDLHLISTVAAESAIVERATGAGYGSPEYEILEHNGRRVSLGRLFPSEKMEVRVWHDSFIVPSILSLTSNNGKVEILQEVKIKSKKEALIIFVVLVLAVLFLNWFVREIINLIVSKIKLAWEKHNNKSETEIVQEESS